MMAYRIVLECGDTSSLRAKKTVAGFTHDWEVWIKGVDNAPIHHYIDKVVFNLHQTFHKPKRVIKEPPYCLKESGYAGFDIPIHVYLKNKNEPKRFEILYNLNLDTTTQTISHHSRHVEIIVNPSEEFRKKLLKGGASPTNADNSQLERSETKTLMMVGKPKLSGNSELKKHRVAEPRASNQFSDLFGPPIKTAKLAQETKKTSEKSSSSKAPAAPEKSDKIDKSTKVKHSPHKDSKKEKSSEERKEKREKEKDASKEKEKSKDKSKRSSSPSNSKVSHGTDKRPSPTPMKKAPSPVPVPKRSTSPSSKPNKEKEMKKEPEKEKDKDREKEKSKESSSSKGAADEIKSEKNEKESKSERKKEKKKHKEDRDKEKKDKHRDKEREKSKDKEGGAKNVEKKVEKGEKVEKEKPEAKALKDERKSPKSFKEIEKVKEEKMAKPEKSEKIEKEKSKEPKAEKPEQKSKHKHKKKDKKEKREGSREREKKEKREKSKNASEHKSEVVNHATTPTPVTTRIPEITDRDSSDSSGDEDSVVESRLSGGSASKRELPPPAAPAEVQRTMSPPPAPVADNKKDKSERKRDRSKSRREEKESKKRKRKSESKGLGDDEVSPAKKSKDRGNSTSPPVEPVSSSQSPIAANADLLHSKVKHEDQTAREPATGDGEQVAPDSTNSTLVETDEPLVFSEDYVLQLKELQQKIMMLQDNQELQRVVQVIAETGQYEITKKTFDFDLCALDRRTVQRLQQFFAS